MRVLLLFLVACGGVAPLTVEAPDADEIETMPDAAPMPDMAPAAVDAAPTPDMAPASCGKNGEACCVSNFVEERCPRKPGINPSKCVADTCILCGTNGAPCCDTGPNCLGGMHCAGPASANAGKCY